MITGNQRGNEFVSAATETLARPRKTHVSALTMPSSKAISPEHMHGSDAVGQMMAKYDKDKSGSFSTEE